MRATQVHIKTHDNNIYASESVHNILTIVSQIYAFKEYMKKIHVSSKSILIRKLVPLATTQKHIGDNIILGFCY